MLYIYIYIYIAHHPRACALRLEAISEGSNSGSSDSAPPPVMTWILYHLAFCPYRNGNALRVRRGSFTIWSNPKTLNNLNNLNNLKP